MQTSAVSKMRLALVVISTIVITIESRISIDINVGKNISDTNVSFSGCSEVVIDEKGIALFNLHTSSLRKGVQELICKWKQIL